MSSFRVVYKKTHQELKYPNVTLLYFATTLASNAFDGGVPLVGSL